MKSLRASDLSFAQLRFLAKYADTELEMLIEKTVPPVDISRVMIFRAPCAKHEKQAPKARD